jgi:hypothetical protein
MSMPDPFDLEDIESHIKKIESDLYLLLKQLTSDSIPDRNTLINRDYFQRIQQFDIIKNTVDSIEQPQFPIEEEPRNTVQFIKSILTNIPENFTERKRFLEKLLAYFGGISTQDKAVLIDSLVGESPEKIKAAITEILQAFS